MDTIKNLFLKYKEIIMYLIMGVATTVVSWGVFALAVRILPLSNEDIKATVANIISWILAVIFAYVTNKIWVFESYSWKIEFIIKEFSLFVSARLITGLLEIIGVPLLIKLGLNQTILGTYGMASKIFVSVFVVILNYVFSKLIIFKKDSKEK